MKNTLLKSCFTQFCWVPFFYIVAITICSSDVWAQNLADQKTAPSATPNGPAKWIEVKPVVNAESSFQVRIDVDKPDRIYYAGETMTISAIASADCHLYLLYFSGDRAVCLFPNQYAQDNRLLKGQRMLVPGVDSPFELEATAPFGKETLVAVASRQPIVEFSDFAKGPVELSSRRLKDFRVRVREEAKKDWAECRINITTSAEKIDRRPRRFAVCIGLSRYASSTVDPLQVSDKDARRFAKALKENCHVNEVILLVNEQATADAIEKAIFEQLAAKVMPGDTVIIYYSGHGWRVSDVNGDETDGFDEVLVPYDGEFGKPETMILDDTFARWMQELDGCQIGIILDNCYSGGSSKSIKGLGRGAPQSSDFFDGELNRAKDLGQSGTMVLAACQPDQLAWEMPDNDRGSVLSYFILRLIGSVPESEESKQRIELRAADANNDGKLTFGETFAATRLAVRDYVSSTFGEEQEPLLLDNAGDLVLLKP